MPGHWEGDLIKGAGNRSAVGTVVERKARYVVLRRMRNSSAESALEGFTRQVKHVPAQMRQSLTYDRGSEMARHADLARRLKLDIGFANPYAPWQRGSNAENPHPEGFPVAEWSWRVVFLHSLVGRAGGLNDEKFGTTMAQATYEMASPQIPPASIRSMLERIPTEANYLREREGRLYADTAPTLNNILRRIQEGVSEEQALDRVEQTVRGMIRSEIFEVHANISAAEDLPDEGRKPQLGVVSFRVSEFDPTSFVEQRGESPRVHQNMVFLLAPSTAHPQGSVGEVWSEQRTQQERRTRQRILALARKAIAVEKLRADPQSWGVHPEHLKQPEFRETRDKIPHEMQTAVEESYRFLAFPGRDGGRVVIRDLSKGGGPAGGGSSGLMLEDAIRQQLTKEGELITPDYALTKETLIALNKRFFASRSQVSVSRIQVRVSGS